MSVDGRWLRGGFTTTRGDRADDDVVCFLLSLRSGLDSRFPPSVMGLSSRADELNHWLLRTPGDDA